MTTGVGRIVAERAAKAPEIGVVFWNRLEPRPRTPEIADALAARVRDPLWMLTRQWQFGEFAGEDAGSPAYVKIQSRSGPVLGWRATPGSAWQPTGASLEKSVESESITTDLATRIELGHLFARLLADTVTVGGLPAILAAYRRDYAPATAGVPDTDRSGVRLAAMAAGRAIDGVKVAAVSAALPVDPAVAAESVQVQAAVDALRADIAASLGALGSADAPAWRRESLEYEVEVAVHHPTTGPLMLRAAPDRDGGFDWFAFDAVADGQVAITGPHGVPLPMPPLESISLVPAFASFRGMPNHRWWDFERGSTDFGAVTPDRRDVAKMLLMDFMLIHSNDYFVIAFEQQVGTACSMEQILVHDVFGVVTLVERADRMATDPGKRWSCFSLSTPDRNGRPSDLFLLPPSAGVHRMSGDAVEDVRFVRDEQANYVWAIEQSAEGSDGLPRIGRERHDAEVAKEPTLGAPVSASPLTYRLQTFVPWHWFPMVPVKVNGATGETALEQGRMVRPDARIPEPLGRILSGAAPYRVREEAVSRVGVRVIREAMRSRDILGDTHFWIARRKLAGHGEGSSGLRYDVGEKSSHA